MNKHLKLFSDLVRNDHFRDLFLRYFGGAALVALVIIAVYAGVSYRVYSMYLQSAVRQYHERSLYKTSDLVDYVFEGIEQDFYLLSTDERLLDVVSLPEAELSALSHRALTEIIDDLFYRTVLAPAMDSIYVYSFINENVITWTEIRPFANFADRSFLDLYHEGHAVYARRKGGRQNAPNLITVMRDIYRDDQKIATAAFNLKQDVIARYIGQGFEKAPEQVYAADKNGDIFYTSETNLLNTNMGQNEMLTTLGHGRLLDGSAYLYWADDIVSSVTSQVYGYTVVSAVKGQDILDFRNHFIRMIAIGMLIGLGAAFVVAVIISYRLYSNVLRLITYYGTAGNGGTAPEINSEAAYITQHVASLVARNKHIESELAEKLVELKKAQAIALQNQINPHFILNTLQMVNLDIMRQARADTPATQVIALLSDILKSNLNTTDHIVTLAYEISQAGKYLQIENIRNKGKFMVDWQIDDALLAYRTVKFIIQPILENAIKHGLANSLREEKRIGIEICLRDNDLYCVIWDNGAGLSEEAVTALCDQLRNSHIQENSHIGLCNVDKRIKLVFGEGYGVSVESKIGNGTKVTIRQRALKADWT